MIIPAKIITAFVLNVLMVIIKNITAFVLGVLMVITSQHSCYDVGYLIFGLLKHNCFFCYFNLRVTFQANFNFTFNPNFYPPTINKLKTKILEGCL